MKVRQAAFEREREPLCFVNEAVAGEAGCNQLLVACPADFIVQLHAGAVIFRKLRFHAENIAILSVS